MERSRHELVARSGTCRRGIVLRSLGHMDFQAMSEFKDHPEFDCNPFPYYRQKVDELVSGQYDYGWPLPDDWFDNKEHGGEA